MHVVERWNRALAAGCGALWSLTNPVRDDGRHSVAGRILSTLPDQPGDRMLSHLSTEHSDVQVW
jgi:hypothetical protein